MDKEKINKECCRVFGEGFIGMKIRFNNHRAQTNVLLYEISEVIASNKTLYKQFCNEFCPNLCRFEKVYLSERTENILKYFISRIS